MGMWMECAGDEDGMYRGREWNLQGIRMDCILVEDGMFRG